MVKRKGGRTCVVEVGVVCAGSVWIASMVKREEGRVEVAVADVGVGYTEAETK